MFLAQTGGGGISVLCRARRCRPVESVCIARFYFTVLRARC